MQERQSAATGSTVYNRLAFRAWRKPVSYVLIFREEDSMAQLGTGEYTYELIPDFLKLPAGHFLGRTLRTGEVVAGGSATSTVIEGFAAKETR